jgi:2-dehydropantoate 2-reductase
MSLQRPVKTLTMPHPEFAILGAGALGTILGAHLVRAGHSVVMLARGQRAAAIAHQGLRIKGLVEISTPVEVLTDPAKLRRADTLIVATKAIGTAAALEPLRAAEVDLAFSIQNGVLKDELLAAVFGRDTVLGALANTSGELLASGEVLFTRNVSISIGELAGGPSMRAASVARTIDASGVRSAAVANIESQEWSKFTAWIGLATLAVTTRANSWKYLGDSDAARALVRLQRETGRLADACGVPLSDESMMPVATLCRGTESEALEIVARMGSDFRANAPQHRMSILQDLEAARPLEVQETLGHAVRLAAEHKLSLPLLENAYQLLTAIDRMARAS